MGRLVINFYRSQGFRDDLQSNVEKPLETRRQKNLDRNEIIHAQLGFSPFLILIFRAQRSAASLSNRLLLNYIKLLLKKFKSLFALDQLKLHFSYEWFFFSLHIKRLISPGVCLLGQKLKTLHSLILKCLFLPLCLSAKMMNSGCRSYVLGRRWMWNAFTWTKRDIWR